jgi:hypothetical protein
MHAARRCVVVPAGAQHVTAVSVAAELLGCIAVISHSFKLHVLSGTHTHHL